MRALPNPDAPARSQLDPGLHYVGPRYSAARRRYVPL
jgi:hypothetical protein